MPPFRRAIFLVFVLLGIVATCLPVTRSVAATPSSTLILSLRADPYAGSTPTAKVFLAGRQVAALPTTSAWKTVSVRIPRAGAGQDLAVMFDQDAHGVVNGVAQDRNLYVRMVSVDSRRISATATKFDAGTGWVLASDARETSMGSEKLAINGALHVSVPPLHVAASTRRTVGNGHNSLPFGLSVTGVDLIFASDADRIAQLDAIKASGATWVRVDIAAPQLTWVDDQQYAFAGLDRVVELAGARGINVLGIIELLPAYAHPNDSNLFHAPVTSAERAAFVKFASVVASRYKGRIAAYEVWNEPNTRNFWYPTPSAQAYAELYAQTAAALRGIDPTAKLLTGGTGGASSNVDIAPRTFIKDVLTTTSGALFDGVGIHAYPNLADESSGELGVVGDYRSVIDQTGFPTKQLWLTETGSSTNTSAWSTSEAGQVTFVDMAYRNAKMTHDAGPLFYYTLRDGSGPSDAVEARFGVMTHDGSPKPAYAELQAISRGKLG